MFAITLVPVFNFTAISRTSLFAERYLFIPSFAVVIPIAILVGHLPSRTKLVLSGSLIVLFAALAFARNKDWSNNETFYASVLTTYPECMMVRVSLAEVLMQRGDVASAKKHFETAIEHGKSTVYFQAPHQSYRAFVGLAGIAAGVQNYEESKNYLQEALKLYSGDSGGYALLGFVAMAADGDVQAALSYLQRAVQLDPLNVVARDYLGTALLKVNRYAEAAKYLQDALRIDPSYKQAQIHLCQAFVGLAGVAARAQQYNEAKKYLHEALEINPNDAGAYTYLGGVAMQADGDYQAALSHLRKAVELGPQNEVAHDYLGTALFNMGRYEEAAKYFQDAIQINPNYKDAQTHLTIARQKLSRQGQ